MNKFQLADQTRRPQFQTRVRHYHRHGAKVRRLDSRWASGKAVDGMSRWNQDDTLKILAPKWLHTLAIVMAVIGLAFIITEMVIVFQTHPRAHAAPAEMAGHGLGTP